MRFETLRHIAVSIGPLLGGDNKKTLGDKLRVRL